MSTLPRTTRRCSEPLRPQRNVWRHAALRAWLPVAWMLALLPLSAAAAMASAAPEPGLQCTVDGTRSAGPGEPVRLRLHLHNAGSQAVQVLHWGTPFEPGWFAPYVTVQRGGTALLYGGATVKRGDPDASQYLRLAAGATETAEVDLAAVFDIVPPGAYRVQPQIVLHDVAVGDAARIPRPRDRHRPQPLACAAWAFERTR